MPCGTIDWRPNYSSIQASWGWGGFSKSFHNNCLTVSLSCHRICAIMCWGVLVLLLKILPLHYFQTYQMTKLRTKVQALLTISLAEKFFLHFFKVLVMLILSRSVCLKIEATQSHMVEVKGKRLSKWFIVSSCKTHRGHLDGPTNPIFCRFSQVRIFFCWTSQMNNFIFI